MGSFRRAARSTHEPALQRLNEYSGTDLLLCKLNYVVFCVVINVALSLRSMRQHKARSKIVMRSEPTKWATANGCRPFHGLDIAPNLTWGSAFGYTPGFILPPAPRAWIIPKYLIYRIMSQ